MNLNEIKKIYFIGIGGIGMSAVARYFNERGVEVFGYDKTETTLTKKLAEEGMKIHFEEDLNQIPEGIDVVVYTPAVPATHTELVYFKEEGFEVIKRAEALGIISRGMKTIAIAGTHGKTSTTSITTHVLQEGGVDCSAFLGGIAQDFSSNFVSGKSDWVVVEADEFDRSFLHLDPDIAVITSIDADHLDIYGDHETMLETGFRAFAKKLKPGGELIIQHSLAGYFPGFEGVQAYGVLGGTYCAENIRVEDGFFVFDYRNEEQTIPNIKFTLPGRHNIENATAAITIALKLGVKREDIKKALASFKGIKRRFDIVYKDEKVVYIDDYAHHPSELKAAIGAARELFPTRQLTGIFQPHLFSRTNDFAEGFAEALDGLDEVLLLDIYPARELPMKGVTSKIIFDKMELSNKKQLPKEDLLEALEGKEVQVLMTLGAGDIDRFIDPIKKLLEKGI
jgi:UDP-N-acetylmuramate--alanine ligase